MSDRADLISRAAAIEYLMTNMGWHDEDGYAVDDTDEKRAVITDLVNGIPAVDAVPIVRCKDCKYSDVIYNTTLDTMPLKCLNPPELVRFIINQFDAVIYEYHDGKPNKHFVVNDGYLRPGVIEHGKVIYFSIPRLPMRKLIVERKMPPTRLMRYCCEELKEVTGEGRVVVTGVRSAESRNRKQNQGMVTFPDKKVASVAEENGANFTLTVRGGWY